MGAALCGQRSGAQHLDDFAALAVRARRGDAPQRLATVCADPEKRATPRADLTTLARTAVERLERA